VVNGFGQCTIGLGKFLMVTCLSLMTSAMEVGSLTFLLPMKSL
jgi:hypothetical protein